MLPEPVIRLPGTQGTQGTRAPRAPSSPRLVTAIALQPVTEQPGKDQEISGTPQNLWVGCNKWRRNGLWIVMADSGELMLILDSKHQV